MNPRICLPVAFLLFFSTVLTFAQAPNWLWAKSAGGINIDEAAAVCTDAHGNVYVTGSYDSDTIQFGSINLVRHASSDIFVVKYDSLGNVLWAKTEGGTGGDLANSICIDASGNVFVTGSFTSPSIYFGGPILPVLFSNGSADMFIFKFDSSGNALWGRQVGGPDYDVATAVMTDSAGSVYVTGYFYSDSIMFAGTALHNHGGYDVLICKFDSSGNKLWGKSTGGVASETINAITADASANLYVTGSFASDSISFGNSILVNTDTAGTDDLFIAKYDSSGNVLWARSAGGISDESAVDVVFDGHSTIFVAGSFRSDSIRFGNETLINANPDSADIYLAALDTAGIVRWAKSIQGNKDDFCADACLDADGNVYLTGSFESDSLVCGKTALINSGANHSDLLIIKFDSSGNSLWAKSAGAGLYTGGAGIAIDATQHVYVAGRFRSIPVPFGSTVLTCAGFYDMFVAQLAPSNCVAHFSIVPDILPHNWIAYNQATGVPPLSYSWNWGDSTTSTGSSPTHIYSDSGYYNISLTITDNYGCIATYSDSSTLLYRGASNSSMVTVNVQSPVGISEISFDGNPLKIIPNPSFGQFTVSSDELLDELIITNLYGQTVYRDNPRSKNSTLQFPERGIYFVQVRCRDRILSRKLISNGN